MTLRDENLSSPYCVDDDTDDYNLQDDSNSCRLIFWFDD